MVEILIPKLGMTMTDAKLAEWLVPDGAEVTAGQDIYAVETDKTIQEITSPVGGRIKIIAAAGAVYPVGELIAEIEQQS